MMKKTLIAGILLAASSSVMAGPSAGDYEIEFAAANGGLAFQDGESRLNVGVNGSKFLTLQHEAGVKVWLGNDSTLEDSTSLSLGGFYEYNLRDDANAENWWYGGASLDLGDILSDADQPMWLRLYAGKQFMLSDDVSFNINGGFNTDMGDTEAESIVDVRFGLSVFF